MKSPIDLAPVGQGEVLLGRYRIERAIGVGGMAVVVAATHLQLDQLVAIKFLLPHVLISADIVARFTREARAAVRIRNEHVARVIDVGNLESGAPFMVMEYLEGQDLASLLRSRRRLSVSDAVDYMLQACEALAVAHGLGIVHRDLKPANLFLVESHGAQSIKVLDFGISKTSGLGASQAGSGAGMTQSASLLGSPSYMSPEQMDSARDVDGLTDIWALGIVLYELLTGRQPFVGSSLPNLCMAIMQKTPEPLRALVPDMPAGLEAVVLRCLEKDKTRRYQSIAELAVALESFAPARSRLSLERIAALANKRSAGAVTEPPLPASHSPRVETVAVEGTPAPESFELPSPSATQGVTASGPTGWGRTAAERRQGAQRWLLVAGLAGAALLASGAIWVIRGSGGSAKSESRGPTSAAASNPSAPAPKRASPPRVEPKLAPPPATSVELKFEPGTPEVASSARASAAPDSGAPSIQSRPPKPVPAPGNGRKKPPTRPSEGWEEER
jgi:eukaryotic-like serine/threonine-protein kinase